MRTLLSVCSAIALLLSGCTTPPTPGQPEAGLLRSWGPPSARHNLAAPAAQRLEYNTGPYGRTTWMVDIDATGHVLAARQVLDEASFLDVQTALAASATGISETALLLRLGRPGERRRVGWQGHEVWAWRYPTNDCLWFEVTLGADRLVRDAGYGIDPRCDARHHSRD